MDILSFIFGLLTGMILGIWITHIWLAYQRQESTAKLSQLFNQLWQDHFNLMKEMKHDLDNPEYKFQREFFALNKNKRFNLKRPCLAYFFDDHTTLNDQLKTLSAYGLIREVSESSDAPAKYQFNEHFVELLRGKQP
ncbi:MAG: hypothetical protein IPI97_12160 [Nitrosomonas sp.]|nr:hypothetical protein [Nitrosomonas sp.]MBK7365706.1 hypothetical protein [Nitrosomonas sp.]